MRKESTFTATDGRDRGKQFHLREMSASQAESWALRALLAIGNAGVEIPEEVAALGAAGLVSVGLRSLLSIPYDKAEPLLAEMMACVQVIPDASKPHIMRALIEDDIEEVSTRFKLRRAIWELHTDFFTAAAESTSGSSPAAPAARSAPSSIAIPRKR